MRVELNTGLGWKKMLNRNGSGQITKNLITGSILQDLRAVHFWIAQRSAAENVERIYTGYVANPSNNEEFYLIIDYHNMELKEIYFDGCCSMVRRFPQKLCEQTVLFWKYSSKQDWKKGRKIPGISAMWNTPVMSWKHHRLTENYVQDWEEWLWTLWMHFILFKCRNNKIARYRVIYC